LSERKYIGCLFRSREDTIRESELVVFITPEILIPHRSNIRPREEADLCKTHELLERIPVAPVLEWPNCDVPQGYDGIHMGAPGPYAIEQVPTGQIEGRVIETPQAPAADQELLETPPTSSRRHRGLTRLPPIDDETPRAATQQPAPRTASRPATTNTAKPAVKHPVRNWVKNAFR
jgi:hypothetical protein